MRKVTPVAPVDVYDEIVEYTWHASGIVRMTVAQGFIADNGEFQLFPAQNMQTFQVLYEDYEELMAEKGDKPAGKFRKEDLWEFVDRGRSGKDALTKREIAARLAQNDAKVQPQGGSQ